MAIGMNRSSFGRNSASHNRAGKAKVLLCAVAVVFGVSFGWTPSVPDTILLPDSLGPLRPGYHLAFGSSTDNIYVASESADIIVVDGNTFQRIKRIYTGAGVGDAMLVDRHNRLYVSHPSQGRIGVIDCATNNVVGSILVGTRPTLLCYSPGSDKLYCSDTIDKTVSVIDCASNALLKVIPVGKGLTAMTHDPTTNKVYAGTRDAVLAISCQADSVVATIAALKRTTGLYVNKRRQKLYVVPHFGTPDTIYVVSTPTDSIVAGMQTYGTLAPEMACNEASDRLYGIADYGGGVIVTKEFDCEYDTLLRQLSVGSYLRTKGLVCDTIRNRLYYYYNWDGYGYLHVIDCATLGFVFRRRVENDPYDFGGDRGRRRVLCVGGEWEEAALAVFDCDSDSLSDDGVVPLRGWQPIFGPTQLCHVSSVGKLYYRWGDAAGGLGVIDEQTNRVVRHVIFPQGSGVGYLAYSRTSGKLYCGARPGLVVLDVATDSVLKLVEIGRGVNGLCWYPEGNKLYCYDIGSPSWYIAVLDCYTDSVIKEIPGPNVAGRLDYLGNGRMLCRQGDRLRLIDCRNDSVLVDTVTGEGVAYLEAHTGDGEKIYIAHAHQVDVLDASSLAVLTTIEWEYMSSRGDWPSFAYSDSTDKLYWFACDNENRSEPESALVIDTRGDTIVARLSAGVEQRPGCLDHTGRYIFCPDAAYDNSLVVYDSQVDSVAAVYSGLPGPVCVKPNPERGQIYVGCSDVILVYPDTPPGIEEALGGEARAAQPEPTVARGILFLPRSASTSLLDVSGREVITLMLGENDVRALAPGVYFVREEPQAPSFKLPAVRKIVIAK